MRGLGEWEKVEVRHLLPPPPKKKATALGFGFSKISMFSRLRRKLLEEDVGSVVVMVETTAEGRMVGMLLVGQWEWSIG